MYKGRLSREVVIEFVEFFLELECSKHAEIAIMQDPDPNWRNVIITAAEEPAQYLLDESFKDGQLSMGWAQMFTKQPDQ